MVKKSKKLYKNQLALFRQRRLLEQKQVAVLLGHKSTEQISRYENGVKTPNLRTALKLAQIYGIPIRILLDGYFDACRDEVKRHERLLSMTDNTAGPNADAELSTADFCTIEERLISSNMEQSDLDKARSHSVDLIRKRAEKLSHI